MNSHGGVKNLSNEKRAPGDSLYLGDVVPLRYVGNFKKHYKDPCKNNQYFMESKARCWDESETPIQGGPLPDISRVIAPVNTGEITPVT